MTPSHGLLRSRKDEYNLYTIIEQIKKYLYINPIIPISTEKVLDTINISQKDILLKI